jgi:predicted transposase
MALINHEKKEPIKSLIEKKNESNFITVECLLAFDKDEDKGQVLTLMRKFSSMVRFAYKRLLEKTEEKDLRKLLHTRYNLICHANRRVTVQTKRICLNIRTVVYKVSRRVKDNIPANCENSRGCYIPKTATIERPIEY